MERDTDVGVASVRVFVSYAAADEAVARAIVDLLESRGWPAWFMYRDVPAGSDYIAEIDTAIVGRAR